MDRGNVVTRIAVLALLMLVAGSSPAFAAAPSGMEKLLSVAPDDVFLIAGTSGGDEIGPAFKETVIGKMWNDPQTQAFYSQIVDTLKTQIAAQGAGNDANEVQAVTDTAALLLSRPFIIGVAGKQAAGDLPPAYLFVLVNAGPSKDAIAARLSKFEAMAPKDVLTDVTVAGMKLRGPAKKETPAIYWGMVGDYFVVAVNDPEGNALKHLKSGGSSAASLLNRVKPNGDAFAAYVNIARVKAIIQAEPEAADEFGKVTAVLTSLGLDNVKTYVTRTGFTGGQFTTENFIEAPQPHNGLLGVAKPINVKAFDVVDANCIGAVTMNIDAGMAFDTIMNTVKTADADTYAKANQALGDFETQAGFKIRDGFVASLAGPVTIYNVPTGSADMMGGAAAVAIVDLKDQAKFEENMAALGKFIVDKAQGSFQMSTQTVGERKLNVWAVPQMAMAGLTPTWTVVNGKLVFSTNQQACKTAADKVASPVAAKSLSALPAFKTVTAGLPSGLTSVRYLDSQVYFKMLSSEVQRIWPMATMVASQNGIVLPFMLPDLSKYQNQFTPGIEYSWTDKDGIHSRVQGSGIEQVIAGVAGGAMGAAVAMPALAKVKEQSYVMLSATNLKGTGMALHMYADKHNGAFPKELNDLVKDPDAGLSPKSLVYKGKPEGFKGPDYIYVTGQDNKAPAGSVLVYENPGYCKDKLNVLFLDGHVELMPKGKFKAELKKTYDRLGQPMPTVKFKGEKSGNGQKSANKASGTNGSSPKPAEPNKK
jgi:prepilin-type processing-associated H-X9-DG protein